MYIAKWLDRVQVTQLAKGGKKMSHSFKTKTHYLLFPRKQILGLNVFDSTYNNA